MTTGEFQALQDTVHLRNFIDSRMSQARDRIGKRLTGRSLERP